MDKTAHEIKKLEAETLKLLAEVAYQDADTLIKQQDLSLVKLVYDEKIKEFAHLERIRKLRQHELQISNMSHRFRILHDLGVNMGTNHNISKIMQMAKLLGDIDDEDMEEFNIIYGIITKDKTINNLYM